MDQQSQIQHILERIRNRRIELGYSQEYMGILLQISQNAYFKLESQKTKLNLETFLKITRILKTNHLTLLEGTETEYVFKDYYVRKKNT